MIHQPVTDFFEGQAGEWVLEAQEMLRVRNCIICLYAQRTAKPIWIIVQDMERDTFSSSTAAKDYGIVDMVLFDAKDGIGNQS